MTIRAPGLEAKTRPRPLGVAARIGAEALAALFLLALTVPWQPGTEPRIGPIDYSWMLLVNNAFAAGMQFGRQVILPQGPLAFLGTDVYDPRTYCLLIISRTAIALIAFWSLQELGRAFIPRWRAALAWLLAVVLFMGGTPDCFFPVCAILLLLNYFSIHRRRLGPSAAAMLILLAAASLIKVNQAMYAAIAVTVLTIDGLVQRNRRFYLPAAIYLGALAIFYFADRQSPASIGSFLWGWWQVAFGHAEAVGLPGRLVYPMGFLAVVAVLLSVIGRSEWNARRWVAVGPLAGIAAILLLLYKHSFLRQDLFHASIGPISALTVLLLYLPAMWSRAGKSLRFATISAIALATALLWSILSSYNNASLIDYAAEAFRRSGRNAAAAAGHLTDPDRLTRQWESGREKLRLDHPLPISAIIGTVDVFPHRLDVLLAYGLPYAPRPVCASYIANIPSLASINARYLASGAAAETILFDIDPVDNKYPTLLDAASYPELLRRYDLIDASGSMLVLRRASAPRHCDMTPLTTLAARFDQPINVPDSPAGMIWARIEFRKRAIGKLIALAYKPPTLGITVTTADGSQTHWRLLPDLAGQGFLLSPLIDDRSIFAGLFGNPAARTLAAKRVQSMVISVDDGSRSAAFDPEFTVHFDALRITPRP